MIIWILRAQGKSLKVLRSLNLIQCDLEVHEPKTVRKLPVHYVMSSELIVTISLGDTSF
jgi:hypothetical protein